MLSGTCLTKVETLSQVRKELPSYDLLPSDYYHIAPVLIFPFLFSSLFSLINHFVLLRYHLPPSVTLAHITFSSFPVSRTRFKLYLGELL